MSIRKERRSSAGTVDRDPEIQTRLANAWLLLHQTSHWTRAISKGQDVPPTLRAIARELDELAMPYSGCDPKEYISGRQVTLGLYADAIRSLADAADLMTCGRVIFLFTIFQTIVCAASTGIAALDYMRTASPVDPRHPNTQTLDASKLLEALRQRRADGGRAAAASRVLKRNEYIQRAAFFYRKRLALKGTKTAAIQAAHDETDVPHTTLRRWRDQGYFD